MITHIAACMFVEQTTIQYKCYPTAHRTSVVGPPNDGIHNHPSFSSPYSAALVTDLYNPMNTGMVTSNGRHPDKGLACYDWYSYDILFYSSSGLSRYLVYNFLMAGDNFPILAELSICRWWGEGCSGKC